VAETQIITLKKRKSFASSTQQQPSFIPLSKVSYMNQATP